MNKKELVSAIAGKLGLSKGATKQWLEAYIAVITEELTRKKTIQLIGFATLSVVERAARKGRNPQTGKEITIPAASVIKFTAGKQLKDAVNKNTKTPNNNKKK